MDLTQNGRNRTKNKASHTHHRDPSSSSAVAELPRYFPKLVKDNIFIFKLGSYIFFSPTFVSTSYDTFRKSLANCGDTSNQGPGLEKPDSLSWSSRQNRHRQTDRHTHTHTHTHIHCPIIRLLVFLAAPPAVTDCAEFTLQTSSTASYHMADIAGKSKPCIRHEATLPGSLVMADQVRYMVYRVTREDCSRPDLGWDSFTQRTEG